MKSTPRSRKYPLFLIALVACGLFFASCSGDSPSSPTSLTSSTPTTAITPVGVAAACLTVNPPSLLKLADGNYRLVDEIDNCGGKDVGPLQITSSIDTDTLKQSPNLLGPTTIAAHGKATYTTFIGQAAGANKEIQFAAPLSPSAVITLLATINGTTQGEWDGQVTIPA